MIGASSGGKQAVGCGGEIGDDDTQKIGCNDFISYQLLVEREAGQHCFVDWRQTHLIGGVYC